MSTEAGAMRETNQITGAIVDAAIEIHRALGPGLLESAYEELLACELTDRGLGVERQVMVPFTWKGRKVEYGFRVDLLIECKVVIELKAVERLAPIHTRQVLTYLRILNLRHGLILNFGAYRMIDGVQRVTNGFGASEQRN